MSDLVIRVENLGKKYMIGHEKQERYTPLRYVMANSAKGLVKLLRRGKSPNLDGMYVRLAFAVAAYLELEVLIVEVLAE